MKYPTSKDLTTKIHDLLILKNTDGSYDLFGRYKILSSNNGLFIVSVPKDCDIAEQTFSSLKHAVTWCVFEKHKKYSDIKRIQELDMLLSSLDVSSGILKKLFEKTKDLEDRFIYLAKLDEVKFKKRALLAEINSYISTSKHWQTKKFTENQSK